MQPRFAKAQSSLAIGIGRGSEPPLSQSTQIQKHDSTMISESSCRCSMRIPHRQERKERSARKMWANSDMNPITIVTLPYPSNGVDTLRIQGFPLVHCLAVEVYPLNVYTNPTNEIPSLCSSERVSNHLLYSPGAMLQGVVHQHGSETIEK